ncbi:hypothetical protein ALC57_05732 [Trachymyrmex cornetzi]|uniref:HAT C-terminal dimerisation domain-containing protein n=1 Tax=Trachymyrmex cornetzi TaxID=471704 RepID=A0A151J9Z2_9HYME|nr:hypothetical protein ALC57_05732 [Trachymyrmex cornetzi]
MYFAKESSASNDVRKEHNIIPTESDIANTFKELGKNVVENYNTSHTKRLLKITMSVRRQWIEKESSRIAETISKYPPLKHYEMANSTDILTTKEGKAPRVVMYTSIEGEIATAYIVADETIKVKVPQPTVLRVIVYLLSAYYVWHIPVVRTVNETFVTTDNFYDLIELSDATAEDLYDKIIHSFKKQNVKLVCASAACEKLPVYVEVLVRNMHNYLRGHSKRTEAFMEFQEFVELKLLKMLHPAQTRWLSLLLVVSRVLEYYNALKLFFQDQVLSEKCELNHSRQILDRLNDPITYLYLNFREYILPLFEDLNRGMQSENPQIHILYSHIETLFKTILECYLKSEYLEKTPIEKVQFRNPMNYTESTNQEYRRFPLQQLKYIAVLNFLNPHVIQERTLPIIAHVYPHFPLLVEESEHNVIDNEWRQLRVYAKQDEFDVKCSSVSESWEKISTLKKGDSSLLCAKLSDFARKLLTLPHSSASVERIFSDVKLILTDRRNRLKTETLVVILHAKRTVSTCYDFVVTKEHRAIV